MVALGIKTFSSHCFQCLWTRWSSRFVEVSGCQLRSCSAVVHTSKLRKKSQIAAGSHLDRPLFEISQERQRKVHLYPRLPLPIPQTSTSAANGSQSNTGSDGAAKSINSVAIIVGVFGGVSFLLAVFGIYLFFTSRTKHKTGKCKCAEGGKQCRYAALVLPRGGEPTQHTGNNLEISNNPFQASPYSTHYNHSQSHQPFLSDSSLLHNSHSSRNGSPSPQQRIKRSFDHSNEPWTGFEENPNLLPGQSLLAPDQVYARAADRPPSAFNRSLSDNTRPPVTRSSTFADLSTPSTPYGVASPIANSRSTTPSNISQTSQTPYTPPHLRQHQRLLHGASRSFSAVDLPRTDVELQHRSRANSIEWSRHDYNQSQQHDEHSGLMEVQGSEVVWQGERGMRGVVHEVEAEMVAVELDGRPSMLALKRMKKTFARWM